MIKRLVTMPVLMTSWRALASNQCCVRVVLKINIRNSSVLVEIDKSINLVMTQPLVLNLCETMPRIEI